MVQHISATTVAVGRACSGWRGAALARAPLRGAQNGGACLKLHATEMVHVLPPLLAQHASAGTHPWLQDPACAAAPCGCRGADRCGMCFLQIFQIACQTYQTFVPTVSNLTTPHFPHNSRPALPWVAVAIGWWQAPSVVSAAPLSRSRARAAAERGACAKCSDGGYGRPSSSRGSG